MTELQYRVLKAATLDAGRTRQEIINELIEAYPELKPKGINHAIDRLIEKGNLVEQNNGQFRIPTD